jgi:tetratricopeptide (TPR) repeat protein
MDSIQAQLQIRQNALEAQEYAQDLLNWQSSIKAKSSSTHDNNSNSSKQHAQQHLKLPVRGRASGTLPAAPKEAQQPALQLQGAAQKQSHPAAHTYKNYDKWDKFNVDAALEATEEAASGTEIAAPTKPRPVPARSSRDQQQEEGPMTRVVNAPAAALTPAGKAATLKDQGNKLFQAKYYDDAISCYTQSIDSQPTAVAYANRAMAYLKLNKFQDAEADCSAAVQLDPSYVKAWHRRGTARKQLEKLLEAAADFEECLRLEPGSEPVQADRNQALYQHLKQQQIQRTDKWHSIPVKAQPAACIQVQPQQQAASPAQQQQEHPAAAAAAAAGGMSRPVTPVTPSGGKSSSKDSSTQVSPQQWQSVAAAAQAAAQQLAARLASSLKSPKTGREFESAWRSLKSDVQLQVWLWRGNNGRAGSLHCVTLTAAHSVLVVSQLRGKAGGWVCTTHTSLSRWMAGMSNKDGVHPAWWLETCPPCCLHIVPRSNPPSFVDMCG